MHTQFTVLITAEEAFPEFERKVLQAEHSILAGFRIFDMNTRLRSPEAREIGETWFDLLAHVVSRGVSFDLTVSDFDPVMATSLHEASWRTVRQGAALAEVVGDHRDLVRVRADMHAAVAGMVPRLAFLPSVLRRKKKALETRKDASAGGHAAHLKSKPVPELHTVTHHHKLAVIDDTYLYVGGLDLNDRRFDTTDHDRPSSETWSDVQVMVQGDAVAQARQHLEEFTSIAHGTTPPSKLPDLPRTLSRPRRIQFPYLSPRTVLDEIETSHIDAFERARHLIHIETQYLRSSRIAEAMANAAQKNPDLHAIVILPTAPDVLIHDGNDGLDTRYGISQEHDAVATLQDGFGLRIALATPVRPEMAQRPGATTLAGSEMIHVHSKVLIRDADEVMIGSANLNGRSLRWDTEAAVRTTDPDQVLAARKKLLGHWWFKKPPARAFDPETLFGWWSHEIRKNAVMQPTSRSGFLVPYNAKATANLEQRLPGVTEDIV